MSLKKNKMRLLLFVLIAILAASALYPKWKRYNALKIDNDGTDHIVVLNKYEKADWNHFYGHCDLTIEAEKGKELRHEVNGKEISGSVLTFSYGPSDGNNSQARVNVYSGHREDHLPIDRALICDDLTDAEFEAFMQWFGSDFAAFSQEKEKYAQFLVNSGEYGVYSIVDEKNCVTGAIYMLEHIPGAMAEADDGALDIIDRMLTYFAEHDYELPEEE